MPHPARKQRRSQRLAKRTTLKGGRVVAEEENGEHTSVAEGNPVKDQRQDSEPPKQPEENNT